MIADRIRSLVTYLYSQVRCTEGGIILGRITGPGKVQQIQLGDGLSFSEGKLVATGGDEGASSWESLSNKPTAFPPASHTHSIGDIAGLHPILELNANPLDGDPVGSVKLVGSAVFSGGGWPTTAVTGTYLPTGTIVNDRPTYSPTGQPYSGNSLEMILEYHLSYGWGLNIYSYGSFITNFDQGFANGASSPAGAQLSVHSGGSGSLDPVVAGISGTPGKKGQLAIANDFSAFICVRETPVKWLPLY